MSQAGIIAVVDSVLPPDVPTTFQAVGDGSATPALNTINFAAAVTNENNSNGFKVSAAGSTVTYTITNTIIGVVSTNNNTPTNILGTPFALSGSPAIYEFETTIIGIAATGTCYYKIFAPVRTDGTTSTLVGNQARIIVEDPALVPADAIVTASGAGNTVNFQVTGIGSVMDWSLYCTYRQLS